MEDELLLEPTNWDEIYYFIQSSNVSDPRYFSNNFDSQPVTILLNQIAAIHKRDKSIANSHSITTARCGLIFAGSDKLTEKDFLPFSDLFDSDNKSKKVTLSKSTARIFMDGANSGELAMKVVSAFSPYIDEIVKLIE